MEEDTIEPWAQLVSTTDTDTDPIPIKKTKFTIGRSKGADLSLAGNKLVSGIHCCIEKDRDNNIWIQDFSTNGTLINYTKKLNRAKCLLEHGDEILVVYKKDDDCLNVAFLYQDLEKLKSEENDSTLETTAEQSELDATLPNEDMNDVPVLSEAARQPTKRTLSSDGSPARKPSLKRLRASEQSLASGVSTCQEIPGCGRENQVECGMNRMEKVFSENLKCAMLSQSDFTPSKITSDKDPDQTDASEETTSKKPTDKSPESTGASDEISKYTEDPLVKESSKPSTSKPEEINPALVKSEQDAALEESLLCIICHEIVYKCISVQPCLHAFCAGCYSEWMERSTECPSCRVNVESVKKNHILNNLAEIYLKSHPEKKRSEEDLKEQDEKNRINSDFFKPPAPTRDIEQEMDDHVGYEGYESPEDQDDDEDNEQLGSEDGYSDSEEDDGGIVLPTYTAGGATGGFNIYTAPKVVCRQCPDKGMPRKDATNAGAPEAGPSSGPSTSATSAPTYRCKTNQVHMLCNCCIQPMPDRRVERMANDQIPPQQCRICNRIFCHMYWGCRKADCSGCLNQFGDLQFSKKSLGNLILDNKYESTILEDYLISKGLTVTDLFKACCDKMLSGEYTCPDQIRHLNAKTIVCYACGLRNFRELAYQYRKSIAKTELPAAAQTRPDCYWGRNCRTQRHKPEHAARYSHVCDQTR